MADLSSGVPTGMSQLVEFLYPAPARRTLGGIVGWWERRRLPYNLIVGSAGLVTAGYLALLNVVVWRQPLEFPEMLLPILAFGVGANVCYSLGAVIEIAMEKLFRASVLPVGPGLYRMGLTFSVGLALFPALLVTLALVAYVVTGVLGLAG